MANKYTREQVSNLILDVLRELHFNSSINEESQYDIDIIIDNEVKALCYHAIMVHLEKLGYIITDFSIEDCIRAQNVKDIVDAVWNDVKYDTK